MTHHEPIAHLSDDGRFQPLRDHLIGTAERAGMLFFCVGDGTPHHR